MRRTPGEIAADLERLAVELDARAASSASLLDEIGPTDSTSTCLRADWYREFARILRADQPVIPRARRVA